MNVLKEYDEPISIYKIIKELCVGYHKLFYVIKALKKGINEGKIVKIINPEEKRLFVGHKYKRVM